MQSVVIAAYLSRKIPAGYAKSIIRAGSRTVSRGPGRAVDMLRVVRFRVYRPITGW